MSKTKKYKSDIKPAIHEIASGMHDVGMIDKQTMRRLNDSCLAPVHEFNANEIKALRQREEVSQSVFASDCTAAHEARFGVRKYSKR